MQEENSVHLTFLALTMSKQLDLSQRQKIAELLKEGKDFKEIAEVLGVDRTTILREINRNAGDNGVYNPELAEEKRQKRRRYQSTSASAMAQLPPSVRTEIEKVFNSEKPSIPQHQLIVDKYVNEYGPLIEKKLVSPRASMCAIANEFYMTYNAVYNLLKRAGVYKDGQHPVCPPSSNKK